MVSLQLMYLGEGNGMERVHTLTSLFTYFGNELFCTVNGFYITMTLGEKGNLPRSLK